MRPEYLRMITAGCDVHKEFGDTEDIEDRMRSQLRDYSGPRSL